MMHKTFAVLLALALLLVAGLAVRWLDGDAWRWQPPAPIVPVLGESGAQQRATPRAADDYPHTLARPLFNVSRRPPPPAVAGRDGGKRDAPAVAVDDMRLQALMGDGAGRGVALVSLNGKPHRVRLGETLGGWRLVSIQGRGARFVRAANNGESDREARELRLLRPGEPAPAVAPAPAAPAAADAPAPRASSPGYRTTADSVRERIMRNNALRVQNGLEPEPLPPE